MSHESKHPKSAEPAQAGHVDDATGGAASPAGRYPRAAYEFVSEGLAYSVRKIHGPESAAHHLLGTFMARNNVDLHDLMALFEEGKLPPPVAAAVRQIGGPEKLNRHIGGRDLAWGLREYALTRWGMLARSVLERWNIRRTADFGRIVFETIEQGRMQKQPGDTLDDFKDVFDFEEAFDAVFRVNSDAAAPDVARRRSNDSSAPDDGPGASSPTCERPDSSGLTDDDPDSSANNGLVDDSNDSSTDALDEYGAEDDASEDYDSYADEDDDDPPAASNN